MNNASAALQPRRSRVSALSVTFTTNDERMQMGWLLEQPMGW